MPNRRHCYCRLYHTKCNCEWLTHGNHPWHFRGVEAYRNRLLEISTRPVRVFHAPALGGHFVRYITYHECQVKCEFCSAKRNLTRVLFPGLYKGRSELPAIRVITKSDNTRLLYGLTDAQVNEVIVTGEIPFLHDIHDQLRPSCDCLKRFLEFENQTTQLPNRKLLWLHHAHWQQVDEHHPGPMSESLCPADILPTGLPPRAVWSSKGWCERSLQNRRVRHQITQTEAEATVPSLLQTSLAAVIESNDVPLITPCVRVPEQDPLWVNRYRSVGEGTWVCSEYLPHRRRREAALARFRQQRSEQRRLRVERGADGTPPPSPPDVLP